MEQFPRLLRNLRLVARSNLIFSHSHRRLPLLLGLETKFNGVVGFVTISQNIFTGILFRNPHFLINVIWNDLHFFSLNIGLLGHPIGTLLFGLSF